MRQRFNPHKRVNDYQRYSMLTILPLSLCLAPSAIHLRSELQATITFAGITIPLSAMKDILKVFVYLMMRNVMVKTCLNLKIIKNSNLIQAMKNSVCPKAKVIRRPNFSESRISPNIYRMFRSVNRTHDMIIVKWHEVTLIQFFRRPNLPNIYRMFRSVHWTHDMIIVKWHLLIWHKRKLCALTNAPPVQSTQTGQWLSTLFHTNYSAGQVYVLHPRQFIFALSCRRRSFLPVLQSTECYDAYFENVFVYLMMTNVMVKTCLNQKIIKNSNLIRAMKNSVVPKAKVFPRPNFSESRICPNIYQYLPIFTECSEVWIEDTTW